MQVLNETFYTKDMQSKLTASVSIRQSFRRSQSAKPVEDKKVGSLSNLQMSSDLIEVTVFDGMRANVVARAKAYLDVVTGFPCDFAMGTEVFVSGRDFSNRFAAQKINEQTKLMTSSRKEPYASVLTICEMEVLPACRKRGIATSIL